MKRGKKEKLKTGDEFKSTVTGKELADFLYEYEDKRGKEMETLHKRVDKLARTLEHLFSVLREIAGRLDANRDVMKSIGEQRMGDCVYCRNGYCEHIASAIPDPSSEENISTTQKNGKYYPRVNWAICYLCTKYEIPPS